MLFGYLPSSRFFMLAGTLVNVEQTFYTTLMFSPYEPEPIEIIVHKGAPKAVKFRKRLLQVKEVLNVWRIDEEWWRKPISRLYYLLECTSGSRLTVFQDLITGRWYRQNWG